MKNITKNQIVKLIRSSAENGITHFNLDGDENLKNSFKEEKAISRAIMSLGLGYFTEWRSGASTLRLSYKYSKKVCSAISRGKEIDVDEILKKVNSRS